MYNIVDNNKLVEQYSNEILSLLQSAFEDDVKLTNIYLPVGSHVNHTQVSMTTTGFWWHHFLMKNDKHHYCFGVESLKENDTAKIHSQLNFSLKEKKHLTNAAFAVFDNSIYVIYKPVSNSVQVISRGLLDRGYESIEVSVGQKQKEYFMIGRLDNALPGKIKQLCRDIYDIKNGIL